MSCPGAAPDIADGPQPEATRQHLGPTRDETTLEERKKKKNDAHEIEYPDRERERHARVGRVLSVVRMSAKKHRAVRLIRSVRGRGRGAGTHHDRADVALDGRGGEQDVCARWCGRACSDQERDRGGEGKEEVGTYRLARGLHGAHRR